MTAEDNRCDALLGVHHLGFDGALKEHEIEQRTRQMLARCLNMRNVIAFVGSGVSTAYGCPDWGEFTSSLVKHTLERAEAEQICPTAEERDLLHAASRPFAPSGSPADDSRPLLLDLCDELFARTGPKAHSEFREFAETSVKDEETRKAGTLDLDPLRGIMEALEIRRFLTTNYDTAIETAFRNVLGCRLDGHDLQPPLATEPEDSHSVLPTARSLALQFENAEDLVRLAVAAPGYERGVFHIHGRVGTGDKRRLGTAPPLMVITERDYQRVYLQELEPHQRAYRDALKMALTGNPILFLGLGMNEPDLLRPLRQFTSERTRGGYERPLFALLRRTGDPIEDVRRRRSLYTRFGVKVMYYPRPDECNAEGGTATAEFCNAVADLARFWRSWWREWRLKPPLRKPAFSEDTSANWMIRHRVLSASRSASPIELSSAFGQHDGLDKLVKHLRTPRETGSIFLLLGRQGAGKGTIGQWLVENGNARCPEHESRFFATAHFANDLLSNVEAAASYFLREAGEDACNDRVEPLDRLFQALNSGRHLLVLGGIERLLVPQLVDDLPNGGRPKDDWLLTWPAGRSMTFEVERFFRLIQERFGGPGIKSDVVLTSSMRPAGLTDEKASPVIAYSLEDESPVPTDSFLGDRVRNETARDLYFVLRGHRYALSVIKAALDQQGESARQTEAERFLARLGAMDVDSRPTKTVGLVLDLMRRAKTPAEPALWAGVLQRVALFSTPVSREAVARCYSGDREQAIKEAVTQLVSARLLIGVGAAPGSPPDTPGETSMRVTAHTLVRNHVLKELGDLPSAPGEALRFDLTGWSSDVPESLAGQGDSHKLTATCVDALLAALNESRMPEHPRDLIRAAFGLIRSRWTATAIPRLHNLPPEASLGLPLPHYDAYQRRLANLMNIVRRTSKCELWMDAPPRNRAVYETTEGHLYADEFAWLHNEMAVTAICQGYLADAEALLRSTQLVNLFAERGTHGHRWGEVEISLGLVQMERGHLARARNHIENALLRAKALNAEVLKARATGHLALILHLQGHYETAQSYYATAIDSTTTRGELRALSIFLRHRADLRRKLGNIDDASSDLHRSVAAAQSGRFPDLLQYARVAEANLTRAAGKRPARIEQLAPALELARRVGIPKLECMVQNVQGQVALDQGEFELAERLSTSSISIASALGLRLQMTACLILAGRIADKRGNRRAGEGLLRSALDLAQHQRNQLQIESAERHLMARS